MKENGDMTVGSYVLTPRGLTARILAIRGGRADLRYIEPKHAGGVRTLDAADVSLPLSLLRNIKNNYKVVDNPR